MTMGVNPGLEHLQTIVRTEDRCLMVGLQNNYEETLKRKHYKLGNYFVKLKKKLTWVTPKDLQNSSRMP